MPSESKLRSIYREVLQDQIIIKSIFSTTVTTLIWWRIRAKQNKNKVLCNILCNKNNINNINNYHTLGTLEIKLNILF